ncbi:RrF2 family transcriptional regulator [Thiomicrorhabdus cannonii]|uniref:RrF2 family transcriptional regulator n=1 Tax=Thiomicrorhabdus cannonii TaxID=2748011 RepID=UPI0015BC52E0|nr:Rrf2 family transcriptional regulator [Thiomicrorhabdus cannonii]
MQLSKHTDYAFRVLIYLGMQPEQNGAQIKEIAERYDISRAHLMKVVQKLAQHGFIDAKRGQGGGIKPNRPAHHINCREVIETMEAVLTPINCQTPPCLIRGECRLAGYLHAAQQAFLTQMQHYTLADLLTPALQTPLQTPLHEVRFDSNANNSRPAGGK